MYLSVLIVMLILRCFKKGGKMQNQKILILNFGGQYDQLIARRVRECNVYCEIKPYAVTIAEIQEFNPIGIIFTGGPDSVYKENSYQPAEGIFELGIPILGICYGDYMRKIPNGFKLVAHSEKCPNVAICDEERRFYGVQFHPEVNHTENGIRMIYNFLYRICGAKGDWTMEDYMHRCIEEIRSKVGSGRVLLALSGGVDSSVCAALFAEAIGPRLTCVFVDHGLLRRNEGDEIERAFEKWNLNLIRVNVGKRFLSKLAGITEPEQKRKIIGYYLSGYY